MGLDLIAWWGDLRLGLSRKAKIDWGSFKLSNFNFRPKRFESGLDKILECQIYTSASAWEEIIVNNSFEGKWLIKNRTAGSE